MYTPPTNALKKIEQRVSRLESHLGLNPVEPEPAQLEREREAAADVEAVEAATVEETAMHDQMEPTLLPILDVEPAQPLSEAESDATMSDELATPDPVPEPEPTPELPANPDPRPDVDQLDPKIAAFRRLMDAKETEPVTPSSMALETPSLTPSIPALPANETASLEAAITPPDTSRDDKLWWNRFEFFIGAKAMAWAGALVVLLAMSFFVKLAYNNGWLSMPPEYRIAIAYLFGAGLLVCGEIALRKLGRAATLALNGAGLGTLYLSTLAATHYLDLFSQNMALVLLVAVSGIGILITIRGQLMAIGALSLIGGYAAPLLLGFNSPSPIALPLYTLTLLTIGLVLAIRKDGVFARLRDVTLIAHGIVSTLWVLAISVEYWPNILGHLSTSCLLVCAAAVVFARQGLTPVRNCVSVLSATTWLVTLGGWIITRVQPADHQQLGLFFAGVAVCAGIFATRFGTGFTALRQRPVTALDKLTLTFWAQLGILTAITIGVQFSGAAMTLGWLALAIFAIELARQLGSRGVAGYALAVLAVTGIRIFGWETTHLTDTLWSGYGVTLTQWGALAISLVFALFYAAQRLADERVALHAYIPIALSTVAVVLWIGTTHMLSSELSTTALWYAGAMVLVAVNRLGVKQGYLPLGTLLLATTTGRWLIADTLLPRLDHTLDVSSQLPFWNPTFGMALVIAASAWWAFRENLLRLRAQDADGEQAANTLSARLIEPSCISTVFFLLFAFSMQLELAVGRLAIADQLGGRAPWHVLQLLLTLLWTFGGLLLGLISSSLGASRGRNIAKAAWVVVAICAAKWIVLDTLIYVLSGHGTFGQIDWPLGNLQMTAGVVLAGAVWLLTNLQRRAGESQENQWLAWGRWMPVGAMLLVLWGASFEVSRALYGYAPEALLSWGAEPLHVLCLSVLWGLGGVVMLQLGQRQPWRPLMAAGVTTVGVCAGVWLTGGTLYPMSLRGLVLTTPVMNFEFISGLGIAALLMLTLRSVLKSSAKTGQAFEYNATRICAALLIFVGLWLGYFEIGRGFAPERITFEHAAMIRQLAWSSYTGLFAVGLLIVGFKREVTALRYVGLVLLVLTLGKVLTVDLSEVRLIFRVLSLLITGLLFVGTSLLYARRSAVMSVPEDDSPQASEPISTKPATPQSV